MKLGEKWFEQDGKVIHQRTFDAEAPMRAAKKIRDRREKEGARLKDTEEIGVVPGWLWSAWIKEAGVRPDDHEAVRQVVQRKLMSGEYAKLMATNKNLFED